MSLWSPFAQTKKFLQKQFKSLKDDNHKEYKEIEKLEKEIAALEKKEKQTSAQLAWNSKMMIKFWIIGACIAFVAYLGFQILELVYLILAAYIIAVAMEAVVHFFQHRHVPRGLSIAITYILLIIFALSGFILIVPFVLNQLSDIFMTLFQNVSNIQAAINASGLEGMIIDSSLPSYIQSVLLEFINDPLFANKLEGSIQDNISAIVSTTSQYAKGIGDIAVSIVTGFVSFFTKATIVLVLAVMFSVEKNVVMRFIAGLGGKKHYDYFYMKLERIYRKLGLRIKSQLLLGLIIGMMMYTAFWIITLFGLDIPHKSTLALIAGLTEFVPYLGPFLGGIPAVLVGLLHFGWVGGLAVMAAVMVVQRLENNVIIPVLMHKTLGVSSTLIFLSVLIGGLIMGFLGILLAVPIAVILALIFDDNMR